MSERIDRMVFVPSTAGLILDIFFCFLKLFTGLPFQWILAIVPGLIVNCVTMMRTMIYHFKNARGYQCRGDYNFSFATFYRLFQLSMWVVIQTLAAVAMDRPDKRAELLRIIPVFVVVILLCEAGARNVRTTTAFLRDTFGMFQCVESNE